MTLTESDIEQLESAIESNRRGETPHTPHGRVPADECTEWRERRRDGERPADFVGETEWSIGTLKRHIGGVCRHEEGEA